MNDAYRDVRGVKVTTKRLRFALHRPFSPLYTDAKDIEKSRQFYKDLFGLDLVIDNNGNMILTEGLVLQDEKIWKNFLGKEIVQQNNACELYFEEENIEAFIEKLEQSYPSIQYVNKLITHSWGQKVTRFYDLDGNLIEVGTPM